MDNFKPTWPSFKKRLQILSRRRPSFISLYIKYFNIIYANFKILSSIKQYFTYA